MQNKDANCLIVEANALLFGFDCLENWLAMAVNELERDVHRHIVAVWLLQKQIRMLKCFCT